MGRKVAKEESFEPLTISGALLEGETIGLRYCAGRARRPPSAASPSTLMRSGEVEDMGEIVAAPPSEPAASASADQKTVAYQR
jgi:hypothetical protein